jgi:hypothetical protein
MDMLTYLLICTVLVFASVLCVVHIFRIVYSMILKPFKSPSFMFMFSLSFFATAIYFFIIYYIIPRFLQ